MKLDLRCSEDGNFGFVEKYSTYFYTTGAVFLKVIVNAGGYISEPYVMRGGLFIPAKQIDEEMGISKYIKAKKPFYSVLGTGNLIVDMKVAYNLNTKEYLKDKSDFKMYGVVKDSLSCNNNEWSVEIRRLSSSSKELEDWIDSVAERVACTGSDREAFLRTRF